MMHNLQSDGNIGPFLLASGLLGSFFAPIIFFGESELEAEFIVGYVCLSVHLLSSAMILCACVAISRSRNEWIKGKCPSPMVTTKVVVLWILGVVQCILHLIYDNLHHECGRFDILMSRSLGKYSFIVFTFLQMLFISFCSQHTFFDSWKIKYIISMLTISNLVKWLQANIFSIFVKTTADISEYYAVMRNCSYIKEHQLETVFRLTDMLLTPFLMEYSILAATLILTLSLSKETEFSQYYFGGIYDQQEIDRHSVQLSTLSLSKKHKYITGAVAAILNAPFLFYGILFTINEQILAETIYPWIFSIIGAKIIIFFLILRAFYVFNKKLRIQIENRRISFNDMALILCSSFVSLSGIVTFMFSHGQNYFVTTFHSWFNVIYITYQTIFILFGTSVKICEGDHKLLTEARMIVVILISYNILYWLKDSLFFQRSIENDQRNSFIRTVFFVMYPFDSFYRFQSAMDMIPLYSKLCNAQQHPT